ncbi:SpoIIE family protein phosphatase [Streptomyces sp. NPDC006393]|uniref:SpoIIE family protein phosphatase n=1 Tax=Streptomyces sp. NPDC006393 TaxID=3156763 RepID=UPI0033C52AEA
MIPARIRDAQCKRRGGQEPWWETHGNTLDRLLARSPVAAAVFDTQLRYVWVNDLLLLLGGGTREERLGRRVTDVQPGLDGEALEAAMRQVLRTGRPVLDLRLRGRLKSDPGRERVCSNSVFRLCDASDRPVGVCCLFLNVTERVRDQERLELLDAAETSIGSSADLSRTAQELADFAVPQLADFAAVDLLEPVLRGDQALPGPVGDTPPLRRAAERSTRRDRPESVAGIGQRIEFTDRWPGARCVADGVSLRCPVVATADARPWFRLDRSRAERIRKLGHVSLMWVPIRSQQVTLGLLTLLRHRESAAFGPEDLLLAEDVVSRAAPRLDNARRDTLARSLALALQRKLLPPDPGGGTEFEVASRYVPADDRDGAGGDWFDVIPLSGTRVALTVGDVAGRGVDAAASMGMLRAAVRTLANLELPPEELLARLDDLVIRAIEEASATDGESVAGELLGARCLYLVHDQFTQRCVAARAGHPPPAVVAPDGDVVFPDLPAGPPLGLGTLPFESAEFDVADGGILALYTDGLLRSVHGDPDLAGARMRAAFARPDRPLEELSDRVLGTFLSGPPPDDVALLLARAQPLGPEREVCWEVSRDPAAVGEYRARVADVLAGWGLEELLFTTELIVSELVTNAIRHATGPIGLRLIRNSTLTCEVSDGSSASPRVRHARTTDEGGRGVYLVAQLSRRWGSRQAAEGKTIWAEQNLPAEHRG